MPIAFAEFISWFKVGFGPFASTFDHAMNVSSVRVLQLDASCSERTVWYQVSRKR